MRALDSKIAWSRDGKLKVLHKSQAISNEYDMFLPFEFIVNGRDLSNEAEIVANVFVTFNTITVRDGVPIDLVHKEFLSIDEYRENVSPEISEK